MTKNNGSNLKMLDPRSMKLMDTSIWSTQQDFINITGGGMLTGGDTNTQRAQELARVIPWIVKAETMTALAVSELPFDILDDRGEVYDTSSDWQDNLGGMPIPEDTLYLLAASLCLGKAYLIPQYVSQQVVSLTYCAPHTVRPNITTAGLQTLQRTTQYGQSGLYMPSDGENEAPGGMLGEMMYFWLPDRDVECGPAQTYPARAALAASGLLNAMDNTISLLSERGFITPTILMASGNPSEPARKQLELDWSRFIRGFTGYIAKIFNGDKLTIQKVGAELDQIAAAYPPLSKQAIENIGTAYGIPAALFMSDMAFASEVDPMIKVWYSTSVFRKIYHTIEKTFNTQLLNRWSLRMKFKPESLDAFQEEENDRSGAWATYVNGGADPVGVAKMLGIKVPDGMKYEQIFPPKPEPPEGPMDKCESCGSYYKQGLGNCPKCGAPTIPDKVTGDTEQEEQAETETMPMNAETVKALDLWRQVAVRNFKKGKALPIDFKVDALPVEVADTIREALRTATTEGDVIKAFEIKAAPVNDDWKYLAIANATKWLEVHA